jgi:superfamily II DNA or RNA helicase
MPKGVYDKILCKTLKQTEFSPTEHQKSTVQVYLNSKYKGMLLYHKLGCLHGNTDVLLYNGNVKKAREITMKDQLVGDDGKIRNILELVDGYDHMYEVKQENASNYIVNSEHVLCLQFGDNPKARIDIRVLDYLKLPKEISENLVGYNLLNEPTKITITHIGVGKYYGWMVDGNQRFLLGDATVTHNSGKTCTSILIADALLKAKKVNHVYILTPGSLRQGWVSEYCTICGKSAKYIYKHYTFITYNYMVGKHLPNFDNCLVIIDEVHNFINGVKNQSFHITEIYNALDKSNCRILALSGTPIFNYVYEFALLGNLLKKGEFPEIRKKDEIDDYSFMKLFKTEDDGTLTPYNRTKVKRLLEGIVSYYPGAGSDYVPDVNYMEPIKVIMTPEQEINYWNKQIQETKLSIPPNNALRMKEPETYSLLQRLYIMAKKNIMTRSASNFFYPLPLGTPGHKYEDLPKSEGGWILKEYFQNGKLYKVFSTKFTALFINIVMHYNDKHVLFTFFKSKSGVILIKTLLGMCGIHTEIFSGDLDDSQRKKVLERFNHPNNRYGDKIRVLLVTEAGAEGISVLEARHMHILESSPRMNKTVQAIGRIARYKSHIKLPKNERNVKVWRYWSLASPEPVTIKTEIINPDGATETVVKTITDKKTIDEILYEKGMKVLKGNDSFLNLLKESSVTPYKEN